MDVPYDPACPLLIDSDDESILTGDESFVKKYDDLLSKKMDGKHSKAENKVGQKSHSEAKFVPAFEDDNEELLNYCLKESGFLTDDETEVKTVIPSDTKDDVENEHKTGVQSKEEKELDKRVNESGIDKEAQKTVKSHKKKKKKLKEKSKNKKDRRDRDSSRELTKQSRSQKDSSKREKEDKSNNSPLKTKKDYESSKDKHKSSKIIDDDLGDHDDDEIFALLENDYGGFPLSKVDSDFDDTVKNKKENKKHVKDRHKKERSMNKSRKRKTEDTDKSDGDDKEPRKKRPRSKSSSHKRSKSSESDESERKRKRKKRQRESLSEKDHERYEKKRSENSVHKKVRKDEDRDLGESNRKQKKKKKSYDRDHADNRGHGKKSSHQKKEQKASKYSELSSGKAPLPSETFKSEKNKSDRKRYPENEQKVNRKEVHTKEEHKKEVHTKEGHKKEGHTKEGHKKEGHKKEGHSKEGHSKEGHSKEGHSKEGHTKEGYKKESNSQNKDRSRKEVGYEEKKRKDIERREEDKKRIIQNKKVEDTAIPNKPIQYVREKKPDAEVLPKEETKIMEIVTLSNDNKEKFVEEKDGLISDTDSEFGRLSDIERETEQDNNNDQLSSADKSNDIKQGLVEDMEKEDKKNDDSNMKNEIDSNECHEVDNGKKESQAKEESCNDQEPVILSEILQPSPSTSPEALIEKTAKSPEDKSNDKRPFKLFSQEETMKLHKELLLKDEEDEIIAHADGVTDKSESLEREALIKDEENLASEGNDMQSDSEVQRNDEINIIDEKSAQKPKDDLFDDIFAKGDSEIRTDYDIEKMYEKVDVTSPKFTSFQSKECAMSGNGIALKTNEKESIHEPPARGTPKLTLDDETCTKQRAKSPEKQSPQLTAIPGLEPVSIPGLESTKANEDNAISSKDKSPSPSRIPLLFDDGNDSEMSDGLPEQAESSPPPERDTRRKQPYTPPEEFIGEGENNQFDRYYHVEGSDSPYNPEDLTPIDMGLTPTDASIIQNEALKGTVELKLKDPFSGFDNPTWQKIIEAKSKHETKRQRDKGKDPHGESNQRVVKNLSNSTKQDKLMNMLVRQSRVEQECKEVLKLYYKSKEITKEEYKDILRKAVPQVTMSNSPIIPEKIRSLMKKFVCKCKGQRLMSGHVKPTRKKTRTQKTEPLKTELIFPGEKQFRYLNPNLPMPPM